MSTLRINNIEAQSVPASPTIDEKVKVTNSSGDILVNIDGKTSGITTIGINTTDGNIKFDANSNVLITGILTATTLAGNFTPDSLEIGSNIKLGNAGVITAPSFVGSGANLTSLPAQATIANNGDNRVITGGSGVNLNGEANLTFNGNTLSVTGTTNLYGNGGASAVWGNTGYTGHLTYDGSDNAIIRAASGKALIFQTNHTNERLRIRSDGKISAGTSLNTSNTYEFSLTGADATGGFYAHGRNHYLSNRSNAYASLTLKKSNSDSDATDYFQLRDSSNNLKASISGAGNWKPIAGGGIDFSATADAPLTGASMSNELLDDYEDGSWTPSGFCDGGSVSVAEATYTKIGRVVYVYMYITNINIPNTACQWKLYGLPFTVKASGDHYPPLSVGYSGAGNLPAEIRFLFHKNTNWIYSHSTAGTATTPTNQGIRAYLQGHALLLSGFYFTD